MRDPLVSAASAAEPRAISRHPVPTVFDFAHPIVIAHRGGAGLRPENTLEAFEHAAALGVDAFECDLHLSRDGEVVVIHDPTLDRTTDATGRVGSRTAAELAAVDAGARFPWPPGVRPTARCGVPRLRDLLVRFPATPFVLELKGSSPAIATAALAVVRAHGALDRVCFGGFEDRVIAAVRGAGAGVATSAAKEEIRWALYRSWIGLSPRSPRFRGYQVPERYGATRVISRRFVRVMRRAGLPVQVWTVNREADMRRLLAWGVQALITDVPDVAVRVVREWRSAGAAPVGGTSTTGVAR